MNNQRRKTLKKISEFYNKIKNLDWSEEIHSLESDVEKIVEKVFGENYEDVEWSIGEETLEDEEGWVETSDDKILTIEYQNEEWQFYTLHCFKGGIETQDEELIDFQNEEWEKENGKGK